MPRKNAQKQSLQLPSLRERCKICITQFARARLANFASFRIQCNLQITIGSDCLSVGYLACFLQATMVGYRLESGLCSAEST